MGCAERRQEILKILCRRRHETVANLAFELCVSERTIRRDIETLSLSEPIYTQTGRYGGGVYITGNGTFKLSGGTIKNNSATTSGGGIYKVSSGTYTKSGSPSCSGNGQSGLSSACVWTSNT